MNQVLNNVPLRDIQILTMFLPLFKNLTACAEDLRDNLRGASPPSEPSGENRLLLLLEPDSATSELRLLESDNSDLSSSLFLLACQKESVITSTVVCRINCAVSVTCTSS